MTTVAEYLAGELWKTGVRHVYGLPGGENVEILEALRRQGIEFVLVKNESSACFMAATNARLTGAPGVALTTLGPGATNATAGFAHAWLDRAPILLITAVSDPLLIGRHTHQVLDLEALFRPISKFTAELTSANAVETVQHALAKCKAGRPGPVHLSIHNRIALQPVKSGSKTARATDTKRLQFPDRAGFAAFILNKRKPVIIVGLGLEPEGPYTQLRLLAESIGALVIDTPKSKGALSADHPLFAGTIGLTANDPVYQILDEADCIIALGFDVVELVRPWDQKQPLIWIANWANEDPTIPAELEYVGKIGKILEGLSSVEIDAAAKWGKRRMEIFRDAQARQTVLEARAKRILPQTLIETLREHTPDDVIITTDVGSHKIFTALQWQARQANRYFVSNGLSAMGFGLSSAIAAAQVKRQPTICITGDAGLAMVLGELGLLKELGLPVIVIVMNDSALDLIRSAQLRRERSIYGTEFVNPDFAFIAKAFGIDYRKVENQRDCLAAIKYGLESAAPLLIDVMIDPIGYPTTVR